MAIHQPEQEVAILEPLGYIDKSGIVLKNLTSVLILQLGILANFFKV
jgi:hypothetical protein